MHHISRFKIIIVLLGFFTWCKSYGQIKNGGVHYRDFQGKPYYFGLSFGFNNSDYQIFHSNDFIRNDSLRSAQSIKGPGFVVGIVTNLKLGDYFDLRMIPAFSFTERTIDYKGIEESADELNRVEATFMEIPFLLRYKSMPYKDFRLFVLGGMKYSYDISSKSRTKRFTNLIKLSPHDFSAEVGAGIQFFLPYFIFSPEIKFSQGLGNTLIYKGDAVKARIIDKILSRSFTIAFNFEG